MRIPEHIKPFWQKFLASGSCPENASSLFQVSYQIGADEADANQGAKLILSGEKSATSTLLWELEIHNQPLPAAGDLCVIEDGAGEPVCIVETTWVKTMRFGDVDASFAKDYSETDGTLEDWHRVFGEYYAQVCESMGRKLTSNTPLVCERFRVIYPQ